MPTFADFGLAAAIALVWPAWEHFYGWPRFVKRTAERHPGGRLIEYARVAALEWGLSGIVLILWLTQGRAFDVLRLIRPAGYPGWAGAGLCVLLAGVMALQVNSVAQSPATRVRLREKLSKLDPIIPRTAAELRAFLGLSITAGVCEEFLYRGFLMWVLTMTTGIVGAMVLSSVLFGAAHSYQGISGIIRTGIVGLVMAGVLLATKSLFIVMVLHALIDIGSGVTLYVASRDAAPSEGALPEAVDP